MDIGKEIQEGETILLPEQEPMPATGPEAPAEAPVQPEVPVGA